MTNKQIPDQYYLDPPPPGVLRSVGLRGEYLESTDDGLTWKVINMTGQNVWLGLDCLIHSGRVKTDGE